MVLVRSGLVREIKQEGLVGGDRLGLQRRVLKKKGEGRGERSRIGRESEVAVDGLSHNSLKLS